MKKLNGLIALLLILAAVFCLTACPQPADPDPDPDPTPAPEAPAQKPTPTPDTTPGTTPDNTDPTPTPESPTPADPDPTPAPEDPTPTPNPDPTPAPVTPASFDYSKLTPPENADWTTIDASFDFTSLANTKWMGVNVREQPENGLVEYYAAIYSIDEDATDAAVTMLQTQIYDKNTLDEDKITEAITAFNLRILMLPEVGTTADLITDDSTNLIAGLASDIGNFSDNYGLSFREEALIGSQIDSSNTYIRVLMSRPDEPEEYMYMFNVTETELPDTSTPGYVPEVTIPPATSLAATIDYSQFTLPETAEGWTYVTETDLADTTWIQLGECRNYTDDGLSFEEYSAVVLSVNSDVNDASVTMLMTQIVTKEDESSFTPREIAYYYIMMNSMSGDDLPAENAIVELNADDPTKLIMGVTIDMGNYSDDPFTDGITHEVLSFSDYIHYYQIDSSKTCLRILQSHDTGIYNYCFKL